MKLSAVINGSFANLIIGYSDGKIRRWIILV